MQHKNTKKNAGFYTIVYFLHSYFRFWNDRNLISSNRITHCIPDVSDLSTEGVHWLYHSEVYGSPSDDILLESIVTRKYKEWTKVRKKVRKNNINTKKPLFLAIFESLSGGDDGTWTHTVLPPPDFKSDASADSATSPYPLISGGACRGRTGARRVAVCCLTTWLRHHWLVLY